MLIAYIQIGSENYKFSWNSYIYFYQSLMLQYVTTNTHRTRSFTAGVQSGAYAQSVYFAEDLYMGKVKN